MDGRHSQVAIPPYSLSLILPAYNEAAGIRLAVQEADRALAGLARAYEILVVDDGSRDGTAQAVQEIARQSPRVRLLRHAENRGYGAALRTGFQAARFERVAYTDADCQFHLADLAALLSLTEQAPIAVGYRVGRQDPWQRRFFSWGYNALVRTLLGTGVRDCDCALKVFRKKALRDLLPHSDGFFVNTEMLTRARQLGYDIAEAPVRHRPRLSGASKVSLWDIPRTLRTLLPFWWSRVLFPLDMGERERLASGAEPRGGSSGCRAAGGARRAALATLLLLVVAALLFFSRLDSPLQEPEEARYAEIPREMLRAGNLVVPTLHGLPYYDKPPLLYWLVMGCYRVFGIHDWAARLVSSSAAFFTVLAAYFWGQRAVGARAGFAAAMILTLSARFVYLGRLLTMNSLLCLWVVAALAAAHLAVRGPALRWRWWLLSAGACGLGLLTKGPVALALIGLPVLFYRWLDTRTATLKCSAWMAYLGTALLLAAPWYLLVAAQDPEFIRYFFWKHNVLRYLTPFDHEKPIYAYLPELLLGMFPWSLLVLPLARFLVRHGTRAFTPRPAALGFFLIACLGCFVFYSLAGSKRSGYILPAMPPLALALGCYLDGWLTATTGQRTAAVPSSSLLAFRATLAVLGVAIAVSILIPSPAQLETTRTGALAAAGMLAFLTVYRFGCSRTPAVAWGVCGATTFAVLFSALHLLMPGYAGRFSLREQVQPYAELCRNVQVPVVCYPRGWDSVSFYLDRDDVRVYTPEQRRQLIADLRARPRTLAFVKADQSLSELLRDLPGSMEFVPRGRQAHVTVGWIRPRVPVPAALLAERRGN